MLLCLAQLLLHGIGQALHVANDTEAHIVLHKYLVLQRCEHQSHQGGNLVCRTVPVLRGEGVERQVFHTQAGTLGSDASHSLHSSLMTVAALLAPFCCPASVAVHDDGYVLGNVVSLYHCDTFYISAISRMSASHGADCSNRYS